MNVPLHLFWQRRLILVSCNNKFESIPLCYPPNLPIFCWLYGQKNLHWDLTIFFQLIISPQIDNIVDTSFYYKYVAKDLFGVVNWNLIFEWHELSDEDKAKKVWSTKARSFYLFPFFLSKASHQVRCGRSASLKSCTKGNTNMISWSNIFFLKDSF